MTARPSTPPSFRVVLLALLWLPLAAHGTVVTTATDEDDGALGGGAGISLREAVKYSIAGDTVTFAPGISGQTIRLTLGELLISQSLTIDGSALLQKITLSGDKKGDGKTSDDTRILNITKGTILLDSLILSGGYMNTGSYRYGGAVYVNSTTTRLTIRNSTIADNEGTTYGGGIYFSGALNNPNSFLALHDCILSGNTVGHEGGGIRMFGTLRVNNTRFSGNSANKGCAIYNRDGSTTVEDCVFTDHTAVGGGDGGGIFTYGDITARRSTFSGNTASRGGGIYTISGTLVIENSTFTANSGNAIQIDSGAATLLHNTITANSGNAGGIYKSVGTLFLENSIVAGNFGTSAPNIFGSSTGSHNLTTGNPNLAPLGGYGGPTQTMPPLPDSPAIDAGTTSILITDQRAFPRVGEPDIGAVEYLKNADIARVWTVDSDGDGIPFGVEHALGTDPSVADPANARHLTAPRFTGPGRQASVRFGIGSAVSGTRWILTRSPDLSPGGFLEIYRFSGTADTAAPGVTFLRSASDITITDANPPPGGAFYRFEARFDP